MGPLGLLMLLGGLAAAASSSKSYAPEPKPEPKPEPGPDLDEQALLDGLDDSLVSLGRAFIADVLQPLADDLADEGGLTVDRIDVDEDGIGLVAVIPCTDPRPVVEYIEELDLPIDEYRVIPAAGELHLVYGSAEMEKADEDEDDDDTEEAAS